MKKTITICDGCNTEKECKTFLGAIVPFDLCPTCITYIVETSVNRGNFLLRTKCDRCKGTGIIYGKTELLSLDDGYYSCNCGK